MQASNASSGHAKYNRFMQKTIRAFIAINLPREIKTYLGQFTADLAEQVPNRAVRWVKPDRMHLTLRFLGDTDVMLLPDIQRALDKTAAQHQPFNLYLEGFGCFPNCKRPRVLWTGVGGQIEAAGQLKGDIDSALVSLGWEAENRPFRPHLTVGRVKDSRKVSSQHWPDGVQALAIPVDSIHLIESELRPDGPIYTMRHSSRLQP